MPLNLAASPQTIARVFQEEYLIPPFQRPYSWDAEQCHKLVGDLVGFHQSGDVDPYFLGGIVVAKERDEQGQDKPLIVIDGQQRLTTLSLLIKVIFDQARTYAGLREYLQKKNKTTGEILKEARLVSEVSEDDNEALNFALLEQGKLDSKSIFSKNMRCLATSLKEPDNQKAIEDGGGFLKFVETLQHRVILLPIECTSTDNATHSALRIFRTLNDRGLHLDDSDIFKAYLYAKLPATDHNWFKDNWNGLRADDDEGLVERLFRIDMHVLIAKGDKQVTKEPKLRSYFVDENPTIFAEPRTVIERLKRHRAIFYDWQASPRNNAHINIWWEILNQIPNKLWWHYPLFVFLDKHGKWSADTGTFSLAEEKEDGLVTLIRETARYFYIKGVATNSVDRVKDTVFKVCRAIAGGKDYIGLYRDNAKGNNVDDFHAKLKRSEYGRYRNGLVLVNSALHPSQEDEDGKNRQKYADLLTRERGYNYEHILPRRRNHYPEWDEDAHARDLEELGNIIPFEGHLNKRAGNESFALKKDAYKQSELVEVKELGEKAQWTPEELQTRHNEVIALLLKFFRY